jgi:lipopolysaccharide heptosyltransferase II
MAQPLLARLRERRPGARLEVLAAPWVAPVARRMPEVDEVIEADLRHGALQLGARWRLARRLRARAYTEALVLPNSWKSALVPFFAGIPVRTGYVGEARFGLLNLRHANSGAGTPMAAHYARLAESPGAELPLPLPDTCLDSPARSVARTREKFKLPSRYCVLCPGAEYGPAKRWPYFAELAPRLEIPVVLLGAPRDAEACAGIAGTNLAGRTTLEEAIDLLAGAALVVSNDSGLMHVAAALGRPLVALFGSSSPERTPPRSPRARVLWLRPECSPCFARVCPLGHFRCMRELGVEQVLAAIRQAGAEHVFAEQ